MKAKILLRVASLLILVHLLGHSMGHLQWDKPKDPKMKEVVDIMKGYSTQFMGATKSMANYYEGYSLLMFFVFAMTLEKYYNQSAEKRLVTKPVIAVTIIVLIMVTSYFTHSRCEIWKDSNTIANDLLDKFPDDRIALNNK